MTYIQYHLFYFILIYIYKYIPTPKCVLRLQYLAVPVSVLDSLYGICPFSFTKRLAKPKSRI